MANELCKCERWTESMPQIIGAQQIATLHGVEYTGAKFNFCPWCGRHIAQPVTAISDISDEAIVRKALDDSLNEVARLRAELAAAPRLRWIPVTERLPTDYELCVARSNHFNPFVAYVGGGIWFDDNADEDGNHDRLSDTVATTITHWCELPPTSVVSIKDVRHLFE